MNLTIEQLEKLDFIKADLASQIYKRGQYIAIYDVNEKRIRFMYEEGKTKIRFLQDSEIENIVNGMS